MLETIKTEVREKIYVILKPQIPSIQKQQITLEIPKEEKFGGLSFSTFKLAKILKKNPNEISKFLAERIDKIKFIKEIKSIGGYLNFYLDYELFGKEVLKEVLEEKENYGKTDKYKGRKILIEHTSINPTGPINIGRARNPFIGDTLAKLYKAVGFDVLTHFYVNDMGKQIAIIAHAIDKNIMPSKELKEIYKKYADKDDFKLFFIYVEANKLGEGDYKSKQEIEKLLQRCEQKDILAIKKLKNIAEMGLKGQIETLKKFNINFDSFDFESQFILDGSVENVTHKLKELLQSKRLEDGAFAIDLSEFGIEKKEGTVFQRANGTSVYIVRDIAYHIWKFKKVKEAIVVLGEDHKIEFLELKALLSLLNIKGNLNVVHFSFVSLKGERMSTRKGIITPLDELIDAGFEKAKKQIKSTMKIRNKKELEKIAMQVTLGALRYNILKVHPMKRIEFSWEDALNFEGDSAPYIQYAHARCSRIIEKAGFNEIKLNKIILTKNEEIQLIKKIALFPSIILSSAKNNRPHILANYAYDLAKCFTDFYHTCNVLKEKDEIKETRLAIVNATKQTLKNSLNFLGIEALEKM